jgi:hypothetical protein
MWRTLGLLVLFGLLVVSVAGNVMFLQEARSSAAEADRLRQRALAAEQQLSRLQSSQQQADQSTAPTQAPRPATRAPAAPAPTASPAATAAPVADPALLRQLEGQTSTIRGLQPRTDVPLTFLDEAALRQYFVDHFNHDYLPDERAADQKLLTTLGLLGANDDYVQILLDILQEQVVGVYSEDDKAMYLVGNQAQFGPIEKTTFVHEYTHALEDQHFDLAALAPKHPDNEDQAQAVQGLVEGDGLLTQRLWAQANLSSSELAQLSQAGGSSRLANAPLVVRAQLLFPYTAGFDFVRQVYQQQRSYGAVDAAFGRPPQSTAQVLHPDKYLAGAQPADVALPDLAAAMGAGWRQLKSSVLGEFELQVATEQFTDTARARRAAGGWAGDRWQLLEKDGRQALVLRTSWDTDNDAREFFDSYGLALSNRFNGAKKEATTDSRQALTATTNATELRLAGREVLVVISFDRLSAEALAAAVGGF